MAQAVAQPGIEAEVERAGRKPEHFTARLTATTCWLPVYLAAGIVAVVVVRETAAGAERVAAVAVGAVLGVVAWAVLALLTQHAALPWEANPRVFRDLQDRAWRLEVDIEKTSSTPDTIKRRLELLKGGFTPLKVDASWSTGVAYILQWRLVHELERALVALHDAHALRGDLAHDEAQIAGSALDKRGSVTRKALDDARAFLAGQQPDEQAARALLLDVRDTVNDFRDAAFWQLVEERIEMDHRALGLGIISVTVLALSIAFDAPAEAVGSVALYYLIGMAAALLAQLEKRRHDKALVEIYGYGAARLRQVLQVAGLAATAGVAVVWLIGTGTTGTLTMPELTNALIATPTNILIAAAFGLTPGMLIERISGMAQKNIEALESTTKGADEGDNK